MEHLLLNMLNVCNRIQTPTARHLSFRIGKINQPFLVDSMTMHTKEVDLMLIVLALYYIQ